MPSAATRTAAADWRQPVDRRAIAHGHALGLTAFDAAGRSIATVEEMQQARKPTDRPARASTTDAEARVMKMADGGFRPAYNVQMATAGSAVSGKIATSPSSSPR